MNNLFDCRVNKPYQIVRLAKAEAEAARIQAQSQIEVTDLQRRAMHRFLEEEGKKQENIEAITAKAVPLLSHESNPEQVKDDWITNFFDKSRIVSDEEMQGLWSRILAGEANAPGAFSKRTVNLVADLDPEDAKLFTSLCSFAWVIGDISPLVFSVNDEVYTSMGVNFRSLTHLESLGLIHFDNLAGFKRIQLPKTFNVFYFGKPFTLKFAKEAENELATGRVILTRAGLQLAHVCGAQPLAGYPEYVKKFWLKQGIEFVE